jgi:hypothetical protein
MTRTEIKSINWAEVAARAKAQFGDECIDRFSGRVRTTAPMLRASASPAAIEAGFAPRITFAKQGASD